MEDCRAEVLRLQAAQAENTLEPHTAQATPQLTHIVEIEDEGPVPVTLPMAELIGPQDTPAEPSVMETPANAPPKEEAVEEWSPPPMVTDNGWILTEDPDPDDLIIAYVRGEPVLGVFRPEESPLTKEYPPLDYSYGNQPLSINRITQSQGGAQFAHSISTWTRTTHI